MLILNCILAFPAGNDNAPAFTAEKFVCEDSYSVWISELETCLFVSDGDICEASFGGSDHYVLTSNFFENLSHVEIRHLPVYCEAIYGNIETDLTYEDFLYTVTLYYLKKK